MLINGKVVYESNHLSELMNLDSSFPNYQPFIIPSPITPEIQTKINQGNTALQQRKYDLGVEKFSDCLEMQSRIDHESYISLSLNQAISQICVQQKKWKKAEEHLSKALDIAAINKDFFGLEAMCIDISDMHKANGTLETYKKNKEDC